MPVEIAAGIMARWPFGALVIFVRIPCLVAMMMRILSRPLLHLGNCMDTCHAVDGAVQRPAQVAQSPGCLKPTVPFDALNKKDQPAKYLAMGINPPTTPWPVF